jgi:NADP-dependent 3-hydroxy acid dehydrogenase YdfG
MEKLKIFITGASRGIGFAIAKRLVNKSEILFISSKNQENIEKAANELKSINNSKIFTNYANHENCIEAAKQYGEWIKSITESLDLLVLNAGIYVEGSLSGMNNKDFEKIFNINFLANHYIIKELLPIIKQSKLRRIVFIGSTAGYEVYDAVPGVAKWALRGYAANLRKELMKEHIGVSFIAPGGTLTDMWKDEPIPEKRLLEPDDIAKVVDLITELSEQAVIEEFIVRPILGDIHD